MYSTNKMLALQVRTKIVFDDMVEKIKSSERGQTAVEYAGIALVAGAIIGIVITAAKGSDIGTTIIDKIKGAINDLHS